METTDSRRGPLFRIWIAGYDNWHPARWNDVPPHAVALEPAADECLPIDVARDFVEGFNERMLTASKPLWAVALPIELIYRCDAHAGQSIAGHQFQADDARPADRVSEDGVSEDRVSEEGG